MKKLIAGFAFVAAASVGYADSRGGGGISSSPWIYLPSEGVISNNNEVGVSTDYVLNVKVRDAEKRTLTLGTGSSGSAYHVLGTDENKLPVGGRILDLSESIADAEGNQWTIEEFSFECLRYFYNSGKSTYAPFYEVVFPKELKSTSGQVLNVNAHGFDRVVLDCPNLEGTIPDWAMASTKSDGFTVNLPSLKSLSHISFNVGDSDVSNWNLTGLESISGKPFGYANYSGTLNLPSIRSMTANLSSSARFKRVILGSRRLTLETVGDKVFSYNDGWHYVNELVLGGASGWTIGSEAFTMFGLNRVWMLGSVPTFVDDKVAFGTNHVEKSIVFYVPDTEEWSAIRESATKLTADEIAEFKSAHADWDVPFGIVAADVFHTEKPQYIGTANLAEFGVMCKVSIGCRSQGQYGDSYTVTVDGDVVEDGLVAKDSEVTVTATPVGDSTSVSWEGKLPDGTVPTGKAFTFKATKDVSLYACFTHAWEYDATTDPETISDGFWTLVVKNTQNNNLTLGVLVSFKDGVAQNPRADGRMKSPWAYPADLPDTVKGELNLSGPIYTKGAVGDENARWFITQNTDKAFETDNRITSFYSPTVGLVNWGSQIFNFASALTNLVLNCPDATKPIAPWGFEFNGSAIARLVMNVPNVSKIGNAEKPNTLLNNATLADTDLSEWNLNGMQTIVPRSFRAGGNGSNAGGPEGDLVLPNVETIGQDAFDGWTRIASAAFGTNGTLKSLGPILFWNPNAKNGLAAGPKKLDFGTSSDFTVDAQAFYAELPGKVAAYPNGQPLPIEEVWFAGDAPSVEALDNILALREVAADGTKPVKIFAPMMKKSWRAVCKAFTTEEAAQAYAMKADGLRVIGVYETQDGRRVAWLVQNPGFEYYTGFRIIIR